MAHADRRRSDPSPLGEELERLCRDLGIAELYVFGSRAEEVAARARGRERPEREAPDSDVDVAVRPHRGVELDVHRLVDLALQLERVLRVPRVDVILLSTAAPYLALEAIRGELLHCADPDAQAEFELYVLRRAGDLAPHQHFRQRLALSRYDRSSAPERSP